jgi:DNA-binding winged helix-turn-helix (wHTH) protein/tetratricopeptide (TPR) repeat protein
VLRFASFELDTDRAELRGPDGEAIKLRPKTFALLHMFATNPGRVLSKQEVMAAIWPNVHVGEDSLFQCIREIRAALGDEKRQLVKSVSGRGYLFEVEVSSSSGGESVTPTPQGADLDSPASGAPPVGAGRRWLTGVRSRLLAASATICFALCIAVATPMLARRFYVEAPRTIAVMPVDARAADRATATMAENLTDRLTDGLTKIGNIRVLAPQGASTSASQVSAPAVRADFILNSDLQRGPTKWDFQARLIDTTTGQMLWSTSYSVPTENLDDTLQQSRLTAGIGNPLALRLNVLTDARMPAPESKIVVEQAAAFINQTNRERFADAPALLVKAHAANPDDVDIAAALSAHLMRGVAMVWYPPSENDAIEQRAKALLDKAVKKEPNYIPVLQGYCRLLQTINEFAETLVACENALRFDPWDGLVMFQIGMAQLRLGRFEDALATFERADAIDTPQVSRWTWPLGAGLTLVFMERYEQALPWLHRSLAITPATGRTHLLIAASLQALGRHDEAREYVAKALRLRPGTTGENVGLPPKNQSPRYLARANDVRNLLIAAGLPAR